MYVHYFSKNPQHFKRSTNKFRKKFKNKLERNLKKMEEIKYFFERNTKHSGRIQNIQEKSKKIRKISKKFRKKYQKYKEENVQ